MYFTFILVVQGQNSEHRSRDFKAQWALVKAAGATPSWQAEVSEAQRAARTFGRLHSKAESNLGENSDLTCQLLAFPTVLDRKFFRVFHLFSE